MASVYHTAIGYVTLLDCYLNQKCSVMVSIWEYEAGDRTRTLSTYLEGRNSTGAPIVSLWG